MDLPTIIILMLFCTTATCFFTSSLVNSSFKIWLNPKKLTQQSKTFLTIDAVATILFVAVSFYSYYLAITYVPPPPNNLVFWGLDNMTGNDYIKVNKFIKETNSSVVVFGHAYCHDRSLGYYNLDNVVAAIPPEISFYKDTRLWYQSVGGDGWHGIVIFGNYNTKMSSLNKNIIPTASEYNLKIAKNILKEGHKGIFDIPLKGNVLCSYTDKNLIDDSGRRLLPKPWTN